MRIKVEWLIRRTLRLSNSRLRLKMAVAVLGVIDAWEAIVDDKIERHHAKRGYIPTKLIHKWVDPPHLARMEVEGIIAELIGTQR